MNTDIYTTQMMTTTEPERDSASSMLFTSRVVSTQADVTFATVTAIRPELATAIAKKFSDGWNALTPADNLLQRAENLLRENVNPAGGEFSQRCEVMANEIALFRGATETKPSA